MDEKNMVRQSDNRVIINDSFWNRFRETVVREGIPYQWEALNDRIPDAEPSYCIRNFRIAAGKEKGPHGGWVFQDSDVAKWIEGAAYTLRWHPDARLESIIDEAIETVSDAQQPDGYLDTYYIINGIEKRWTNLRDNHELYCAGHLIEAAVAYYRVTGKHRLMDVVLKLVDHIDSVIGPEAGKLHGYPGHPLIEMALMRLYEVTGNPQHLRMASYFINQRGQVPLFFEQEEQRNGVPCNWDTCLEGLRYYQAHVPLREQRDAVGHAVRAVYLYSGAADVARETGDTDLANVCRDLWRSIVERNLYITGGIGSSEYGEAFTFDYDLPNDTCYCETCAAIGLVFFARRMLRLEAKGEYADVMERALYNGVISGMQLDGKRFFYVNPLEVVPEACRKDHHKRFVKPERQKWFGCACCPPNTIRLLSSLEEYICDTTGNTIYIHLYMGGKIITEAMELDIESHYPWDGNIRICVERVQPGIRTLALRIPGWSRTWSLTLNGQRAEEDISSGYVYLTREWHTGDRVALELDMRVRRIHANPKVRADAGKVALARGPLVYCLEEADNGPDLHALRLGGHPDVGVKWNPDLLHGVVTLSADALRESCDGWDGALYREEEAKIQTVRMRWIPYYAWANRRLGEMTVWVRE